MSCPSVTSWSVHCCAAVEAHTTPHQASEASKRAAERQEQEIAVSRYSARSVRRATRKTPRYNTVREASRSRSRSTSTGVRKGRAFLRHPRETTTQHTQRQLISFSDIPATASTANTRTSKDADLMAGKQRRKRAKEETRGGEERKTRRPEESRRGGGARLRRLTSGEALARKTQHPACPVSSSLVDGASLRRLSRRKAKRIFGGAAVFLFIGVSRLWVPVLSLPSSLTRTRALSHRWRRPWRLRHVSSCGSRGCNR